MLTASFMQLQQQSELQRLQNDVLKRQVDELEQHNTDVIDEADTELINLQKQNALLKTELVRVKSKQVRPGTSKALSSPCLSSPTFAPPPPHLSSSLLLTTTTAPSLLCCAVSPSVDEFAVAVCRQGRRACGGGQRRADAVSKRERMC